MTHLVDWHTHCFLHEHRTDEDRALWSQRGVLTTGEADPGQHTEAVDEAGVHQFVVVAIPKAAGNHTPSEFIADYVARHPGRAVGLCSVHPDDADAGDAFERALSLGLKGLKLSPTYQHMDPGSAACYRLYEIATGAGVPVMFHCGGAYRGSLEFADPWLLDRVALDFPELKIIVAHLGQPMMEETAIMMRKNENMWADLSARFHRPWQLYHGLMIAQEYRVTDRLLFGSDFPVRTPAKAMAEFRAINDWGAGASMPKVPEETIEAILFERPLSLLGIEPRAGVSLPVTVVTGFLGSGKTTLINRLVRHPAMARTAVLVNEFGEIGLDHDLVEAVDEATVLIGAGCLCCAVREDLVAGLAGLLARRGALPAFERILVETSGLADPAPILHTLLADDRLAGRTRIDGIVATVDAVHGAVQLEREAESLRQAAIADRLVLTKTDLATDEAVARLSARLATINPDAPRLTVPVDPDALLDAGPLAGDPARLASWLDAGHLPHDPAIASLALTAETPLRVDRVAAWIEGLLARHGESVLRLKGILDLEGSDQPVAVHGVQHVFHPLARLPAWPEGRRGSRLVVIGRDLPADEVAAGFRALTGAAG